ncbi:MAG: hypothetical protein VKQ33_09560 [Candidatus Sericytochromatia bacterium]|nr:hypothetical protein [Candidatus Sericytochromatia bacterium]
MPPQVLTCALAGLLLIAVPLAGCQNTLENVAPVYPVLAGQVELRWEFEAAGVASVRFELDGALLGTGTDPNRRFGLVLDTASRPNGAHRLTLTALDPEGRVLRTFTSTVIIQNS